MLAIFSGLNIAESITENKKISSPSSQSLSDKDVSDNLQIPANVRGTVLTDGYYLAVLSLCWLLRNAEDCEKQFLKIKNIADLKSRSDIFKCLENIRAGNSEGKLLLRKMESINPILLTASISYIGKLKSAGKLTPHLFSPARNFESFRLQVPIKEADMKFRTFNMLDYDQLVKLYQEEDGTFIISNAITSLFTDIVLSCFMDCDPNLHISSSGSKLHFANLIDLGKLKYEMPNGTCKILEDVYTELDLSTVEPCARAATVSLKNHKYFKRLYFNDADLRFYNFLWCIREYPLNVISDILTFNDDEK